MNRKSIYGFNAIDSFVSRLKQTLNQNIMLLQLTPLKVLLLSLCLQGTCNAQSTNAQGAPKNIGISNLPKAQVVITTGSLSTNYTFAIHFDIDEWKTDRIEDRLIITYPNIQAIEIDSINHSVSLDLSNPTDISILNQILRHFKFNGYEEL